MERKKITGKLYKRNKAKKEFTEIVRLSFIITSALFAFMIGTRYALVQKPVEYVKATATSTPVTVTESPKIAPVSVVTSKKVVSTTEQEKLGIVRKIAKQFPEHQTIMLAIALEESRLNPKAIGYNCFYKAGIVYKERIKGSTSQACHPEHRSFAWSKDGGILQIHQPTAKEMTIDGNLATAKHKFDTQGLSAWSAYNSGRYKKNIPEAKKLLAMI